MSTIPQNFLCVFAYVILVYFILKAGGSKKEENPSQVSPLLPPPQVSGPENGNESQDESSKPVAEPKTEK